ncbi:MAG: IclR family transcriptional regulator [Thermodesulfobacteriota bacterium]
MPLIKIKSASRVVEILELLADARHGMKHKDIAEALTIPKGSLTKLLANLVDSRYLMLDSASRVYKLGSRVLALADSYLSSLDIVQTAQPIVRNLVEKTGESCSLAVPDGNFALVVHRQYGNQPMSYRLGIGARIPLYATASGKAILAFLSKEDIERYLSKEELRPLTQATITDPAILLGELAAVRAEHLAYSRQERFEGLSAMAAPVFRMDGSVGASIALIYLNVRSGLVDSSDAKDALREASAELSKCLGFQEKRR